MNTFTSAYVLGKGKGYFQVNGSMDKCYNLKYKIGEKTIPFIGKIFAFSELSQAEQFVDDRDNRVFKILKGIGRKSKKKPRIIKSVDYRFIDTDLNKLWSPNYKKYNVAKDAPKGTALLDYFIPTEIVV